MFERWKTVLVTYKAKKEIDRKILNIKNWLILKHSAGDIVGSHSLRDS